MMSRSKIKLHFKSVHDIWSFVQATHATQFSVNTIEVTLICNCSEPEEELAINGYSAIRLPLANTTMFESS